MITPELLDEIMFECDIRAEYPDAGGEAIVPIALLRRVRDALLWGADEIVQTHEDLQELLHSATILPSRQIPKADFLERAA